MKLLIHSAILVAAMSACVWVAVFHPPLWQPTSAHDTLPRGANMAVFIFFLALILRGGFRWSVIELMISLLWAPFVAFLVINHFVGMTWSENIASFNLRELLRMSVFIGAPWLLGVLSGSLVLKGRDRFSRS